MDIWSHYLLQSISIPEQFFNTQVKSCKSSNQQHFTVSQLTNLTMHMCGLTLWPAFKEYQEPSQKSRIRTQKFHWNIHFERSAISQTCRWKVATQAVAQAPSTACTRLTRAPAPEYRHSLFSGFAERQHFCIPSQDALHLPASGGIRNVGRFRAAVCILFNSLKAELIHKFFKWFSGFWNSGAQ